MEQKQYHTTFGEVSETNKAIVLSEIERGIDSIISKHPSGAVRMLTVIMVFDEGQLE